MPVTGAAAHRRRDGAYHPHVEGHLAVSFRAGREGDAAAVAEVARITWRETYRGLIPPAAVESFLARSYADETVALRIGRAARFDVADEPDGRLVGFAEWEVRDGSARLVATYVLPGCQRRGIGRAFHERALDAFRGRVGAFLVEVLATNVGGRRFYEAMGYREVGRSSFVESGQSIDEVRYRMDV